MTEEEIKYWRSWDQYFLDAGGCPEYLKPRFDYYKKYLY